jgi:UDP-N-acetylglucosamine--N-acetylmuramyl-(pentapeptide) pyrophosphoryl-undecaprenol N-acetylglucosamine transferase
VAGKRSIVLAAGGTGGHIFPAEALAEELKKRGFTPVLITDERHKKYAGTLEDVETHFIQTGALGGNIIKKLLSVFKIILGYVQARKILSSIQPEVVVGFGGYPSFPTLMASTHKKIKTVLHEQNSLMGTVNRFMASKVVKIATSFEEVSGVLDDDRKKIVFTGNPVRPAILVLRDMQYPDINDESVFRILITGGSQGASVFSRVVPEAIALLPQALRARIRIDQQCRPADIEEAREAYKELGVSADLSTFFTDMPVKIASAHLLIVRSGASTLAEVTVAGRPAILVPYPHAKDNHQMINATALEDVGGGWVMPEEAFTAKALSARIESFLNLPSTLQEAAEKSKEAGKPDAAEKLADLLETLIHTKQQEDDSASTGN